MSDKPRKPSRREAIRAIRKEQPQPKKKVIRTGFDLAVAVMEKRGYARAISPAEAELRRRPAEVAAELRRAERLRAAMEEAEAIRAAGRMN
jgi:hypothetical protein